MAVLSGESNPVNELLVQDKNQDGQIQAGDVLAQPIGSGTTPETISMTLNAGTYYMWVAPPGCNDRIDVHADLVRYTNRSTATPSPAATSSGSGIDFRQCN